jgi:histidyl-tRNA synthetase
MKKGPLTPKGFRDILPDQVKKRRQMINQIAEILEKFGFVPLETPTIEFADTLLGKYGEEEKLIYQFTDRGGRNLALRYDLTVPLARFIANNLGVLNPTFSRYQVGQCFRGENPQAGRFREFTQFDFDIVGSDSPEEDAKVIAAEIESAKKINLNEATMFINDRKNFQGMPIEAIRAIDKISKIGREGVIKEMETNGISDTEAQKYLDRLQNTGPTKKLQEILKILKDKYNLKGINTPLSGETGNFIFDSTLARGLDYYTGSIFELKLSQNPNDMSIGAGGRYDNLIGMFAGRDIPAVGFSFGIDRIIDLL